MYVICIPAMALATESLTSNPLLMTGHVFMLYSKDISYLQLFDKNNQDTGKKPTSILYSVKPILSATGGGLKIL